MIKIKNLCNLCNNHLGKNLILKITRAPNSAQIFTLKKTKKKRFINLTIFQCNNCGLVQIKTKPVAYYKEAIRAVRFSNTIIELRKKQFKKFISKFKLKNKKIIEIGSSDGEYLKIIKSYCKNTTGLEYSKKMIAKSKGKGLNLVEGYINKKNYKISKAKYDAFICMSFLEHAPKLNTFLQGIHNNLNDKSYGIIEVPNFDMILKNKLYFEFIVDHINYFTSKTLKLTLNNNGFDVIKCESIWNNYILSAIVKKRKIIQKVNLNSSIKIEKKINLNRSIKNIKYNFKLFRNKFNLKKIAVWGAGHQALTILSTTQIDKSIKNIIDSATFKQNRYSPGSNIKILPPDDKILKRFDGIIIMAAGYSNEVYNELKKQKYLGRIAIVRGDKFIVK